MGKGRRGIPQAAAATCAPSQFLQSCNTCHSTFITDCAKMALRASNILFAMVSAEHDPQSRPHNSDHASGTSVGRLWEQQLNASCCSTSINLADWFQRIRCITSVANTCCSCPTQGTHMQPRLLVQWLWQQARGMYAARVVAERWWNKIENCKVDSFNRVYKRRNLHHA